MRPRFSPLFPSSGPHRAPSGAYDGETLVAFTEDDPDGERAKGREVTGKTPLGRLTHWLWQDPDVTAVSAIGFAVLSRTD